MVHRKLIWQLYPSYLVVTLVSLIAVTAYCSHYFRHVYYSQVREELSRLADLAAEEIHMALATENTEELGRLCEQLGRAGNGEPRLTLVSPSGTVIGDSVDDPATMENHSHRPEIVQALQQGSGFSIRPSPTLGPPMMYVAVSVKERDKPVVVVRVASPLAEIDGALKDIYRNVLWAGLVIAAGAAVLSLLISRRLSQPIVGIQQIAERFAAGELERRVPTPASAELAALADSLNKMAAQLGERITTITEQRNKLDTILSSMAEGVFAVDQKGRIVSVNPAAANLLGIDPAQAQAHPVEEVIHNPDLQEFVRQTLADLQPDETGVFLSFGDTGAPRAKNRVWESGRSFSVHGARLMDARGRRSGAVIVLNDMTRIRRLENIRRDFVANVSHELKTPVTSIQGFVEALVEGGIQDPAEVKKYLDIVARHASRLNAIIEDLLTLSRLEETGERRALTFTGNAVQPVLAEAIHLSGVKADEKRIVMELACPDDLEARINPPLLEQAVMNLIDNAVKYSPEGSRVRVEARRHEAEVVIAVRDEGCGIAPEHLPRIFERFYVVDKSRSRKLGGTGLGLAIVKHITQVHGGHIGVESTPGQGSTFTIHLPL
jgi:two-component system phosphate regulon sensor histidine kinase PhoR